MKGGGSEGGKFLALVALEFTGSCLILFSHGEELFFAFDFGDEVFL